MQETGERAQRALLAFAIGVLSGCLTVDGVTPPDACPGQSVTIHGSGFGAEQGTSTVWFGATPSPAAIAWSDDAITVTVPPGSASADVTVAVGPLSGSAPFRALGCPLPGVSVRNPRVDLDGAGVAHIAYLDGPNLRYMSANGEGFTAPEDVATIDPAWDSIDLAIGPSGEPQVAYHNDAEVAFPDPDPYSIAEHRRRSPAGWSEATALCARTLSSSYLGCDFHRIDVTPSDAPTITAIWKDVRYPDSTLDRFEYHEDSSTRLTLARGGLTDSIDNFDTITDPDGQVWLAQLRYRWSYVAPGTIVDDSRVVIGRPPSVTELLVTPGDTSQLGPPVLAQSGRLVHVAWRHGDRILANHADRSSGAVAPTNTVVATLPTADAADPIVSADPSANGDAVMLWRQAGTIVAARFDAAGGGWSEPQLVASDAASAPDAATRDGRTDVVWTGSAGDLRYTTLR